MAAEGLECPICLTLPEGEVHQCNEGHCYCVRCWDRLSEPRRCPECRRSIPQANRNRAAERAIAALAWSCEHCGVATTRGAKASHLAACPKVPTACAAAAAGCSWAGVMSEQEAHEAACPYAICLRVMAPLQAQNQQLQAQNQELQRKVAALQPLVGRVRALEGVGTEEGGRRQRQRVGPAPHDAPPSNAAVEQSGVVDVVAALRTHVTVARVAEKACERLALLRLPVDSEQAAVQAGAIEASVAAMRAHPQVVGVQEAGCSALVNLSYGDNAAGRARAQRAAEAGAIEAVVDAMQAQSQVRNLQAHGCAVLRNVCVGDDAAASARQLQITNAGGLEALVGAMEAHAQYDVHEAGCGALLIMCGRSASVAARALQAGGRRAAAAAMQAHPDHEDVQADGQALLDLLAG